jgi:hypothetical protein
MAMSKLPIVAPVTSGYRDAWLVIRTMPLMVGWTFIIIVAGGLARYIVPAAVGDGFANLAGFAVSAAQSFFLTPIMIAVHRFIILEEVTPHYMVKPRPHGFHLYFGWLTAILVIGPATAIPFQWHMRLSAVRGVPLFAAIAEMLSFASLCVGLVLMTIVAVATIRLAIVLPAIAVEASDATAASAWADSKHHTFRIFLIVLLAALPFVAGSLFMIMPFYISAHSQTEKPGSVLMIITAAVQTLAMVLCVAIASRLYQALADRLLRAPVQAP